MTNEELFDELKRFVAATVSQEISELRTELKADIKALDGKVDLLGDKTDLLYRVVHDHQKRIARLEKQRA